MTTVATADKPPSVLLIGGLDPTSGAGISADCAAVTSLGCHPLPIVTAITAQNTSVVSNCWPVTNSQLSKQLLAVLDEWQPQAIKIGLVPSSELLVCLAEILRARTTLPPIVIDPVGVSSSGAALSTATPADWAPLLALATVCTPNHKEALFLSDKDDIELAISVLNRSSHATLLTGTDSSSGKKITHQLYRPQEADQAIRSFEVTRRQGNFHGSGCALASAIAAHLAHGAELTAAIENALQDVDRWMDNAFSPSESAAQMILRHQ